MSSSAAVSVGYLRGALIGVCSAGVSALAHGSAGGPMPSGPALVLLVIACAMVGASASGVFFAWGGCHPLFRVGALTAGQIAGHCVLVVSSHGHAHCAETVTPRMLLAHGAAVPLCALLIGLAERLFVVCLSALSWRTVFLVDRSRTAATAVLRSNRVFSLQNIIPRSVGSRAPPALAFA